MVRCKAKTKNNRRCKLSPMISDGEYCHIHSDIYRNYTDKYCKYDEIGLVDMTVDVQEYIDAKYRLVRSPFIEYIYLIKKYNYLFSNEEHISLIQKLNNEYDIFLQSDRSFVTRNLHGLTNFCWNELEKKVMIKDSKTIEIINDKNLELFYYGKKYTIDDVYKTVSILNFYIDYYSLTILFNNSISNIYNLNEINNQNLKIYKKMIPSKNSVIKNIEIINKHQVQKNSFIRLLNYTILPKDIIAYVIGPFL